MHFRIKEHQSCKTSNTLYIVLGTTRITLDCGMAVDETTGARLGWLMEDENGLSVAVG